MRFNNTGLALLVVALLAVAWCCFLFAPVKKPAAPRSSGIDTATHFTSHDWRSGRDSAWAPTAVNPSPIRVELPANSIVVAVRDEVGHPIVGATVARCSAAGARNLSPSDQIGITDVSGEVLIRIEPSEFDDDHGLLAINAKGFVPTSIKEPSDPGRYEVRLAAGSTVEIECRDFVGRPIPNLGVAVSMVPLPVSIRADALPSQSEPGSDASSTIRYGESDEIGVVMFEGLQPGRYFIQAESRDYLLADAGNNKPVIDVAHGRTRHAVVCGEICVAALETNVPSSDVLFSEIYRKGPHITVSFNMEVLDIRRREIERRFPRCNAIVSLARNGESGLGRATFRHSTISHGNVVQEVPFVRFSEFTDPFTLTVKEGSRLPTGAVCIRVEGDFNVQRNKLRIILRRPDDTSGILCIENETRIIPAARYALDTNDREMARAIAWPEPVELHEHETADIVLKIKDGLMPLTVDVTMPSVMKDQYASLIVSTADQKPRRGRTRLGSWRTWVPAGTYHVAAETAGCTRVTARVVVTTGSAAHVTLELERTR